VGTLGFFFAFNSKSRYFSKEYNFNKINVTARMNLHHPILFLGSLEGNMAIRSRDTMAIKGQIPKWNKIFFSNSN